MVYKIGFDFNSPVHMTVTLNRYLINTYLK